MWSNVDRRGNLNLKNLKSETKSSKGQKVLNPNKSMLKRNEKEQQEYVRNILKVILKDTKRTQLIHLFRSKI